MDVATLQLFGNQCAIALYDHSERSARFTTKTIADLFGGFSVAVHTVHRNEAVSSPQSCFCSRHIFVRIADKYVAIALHDNCANASILASGHHTQVIVLTLRHIDGIRIYLTEHSIDAGFDEFVVVECVHVTHV